MSKSVTRKARQKLAAQQQSGTHNPATVCACGTLRTPGVTHVKGDTGPVSPGLAAPQCGR